MTIIPSHRYGIRWATPEGSTHATGFTFRTKTGATLAALRGPEHQRTQVDSLYHERRPGERLYALIETEDTYVREVRVR